DYQMNKKQERAHFFSSKEQELILKLYEEEREILTAKSNTTSASKLREEAWQRIADKINAVSDSGYKRTWQQVKVKHKNIIQTAKRKRADVLRTEGGSGSPSLTSAEEDGVHSRENTMRVEVLPGGACIGPVGGSDSSFMSVSGHPVLLLPVTKTEPESLSGDETDISEAHFDGVDSSTPASLTNLVLYIPLLICFQKQTDELRTLYCCYLKKEMENRDQEMAYRALKMKKLEKEILLLDKQLM
uniref:Myb/SANT-like DNA-binding domain-containing protein n=1 Tax=Poecilia formosa TaxID=48698 RepID=A0A087Y5Q9_POEFO